jgi:electron transfer flavoprotein beta subunit
MNIVVCMKQILDPEVPARDFRIDAAKKEAERGSANLVTNIFCENALETALQLGGTITALTYGPESAEDTLRKALAMKASAAAHVVGDGGHPLHVVQVLAAAIRKLGPFDLVITGRESGDWGAGQTGALLAEELGLPCVSFADTIEPGLRIRRQTESGWEIVEAQPPLVVTVTNAEHNVPRIPKVRDVMMAHRQPITRFTADELGVAPSDYYEIVELSIPQKESRCEFVDVDEFAKRVAEITAAL